MHEVSIMQSVLEIASEQAQRQGAAHIHRMKMRIGALSGVMQDALEFAFEVVTDGTMAEGAAFEIEKVPVVCWCDECNREFEPTDSFYECPSCTRLSFDIRRGRELDLVEVEVS